MTDLMCDLNERVESRMTPRLRTSEDGQMELPSTSRRRSPTFLSSALGATTMSSVLLLLSLRKLDDIHVFISCKQLSRDWGGGGMDGMDGLVLR